MKSLIVVLPLLVSILGVISKDISLTGLDVKFEEPETLADGNILNLVFDRKAKASKSVCNRWKNCCQKCKGQPRHYGLVITGGDNPQLIDSSEQISSMGVCVSNDTNIPKLSKATAGAKSVWIKASKTLMFCGGSDTFVGHKTQYPSGWGALNTCLKVKPGEDDWDSNPEYNMVVERGWFSLNNINTKEAVAAGGSTTGPYNILDSIEKYSNGKWEMLKNKKGKEIKLDTKTYGHCAVHYNIGKNSFLMIIGGSNNPTNFDKATNAVTVINLNTGKNLPQNPGELLPVWAPACVKDGKDIYVSGGGNEGYASRAVYKGTITGEFKLINENALSAPRSGHTMGVSSTGQLFVAGGYDPHTDTYIKEIQSSVDGGVTWETLTTTLTEGGEYAAMASVPAFAFKCQ